MMCEKTCERGPCMFSGKSRAIHPTSVLRVICVTKKYGSKRAVHDLSFEVGAGEMVGLLGPNGAGKTTVMNMIAGLVRPTAGTTEIEGLDVFRDPLRAKRARFFVPDTPAPLSGMTGAEYLDFVASAYGIPVGERKERLAPYLHGFHLEDHLDKKVSSYSHGTKQKLVLAAAFLVRPHLLMLDEPLIGLDPLAAVFLKDALKAHAAKGGSVLLSTHLLFLAEELCNRVVMLSLGKKVAEGTLASLRARAGDEQATLEKLFLELTRDGTEV